MPRYNSPSCYGYDTWGLLAVVWALTENWTEMLSWKHTGVNLTLLVGFQILTAVTMFTAIFWEVTPYSTVEISEERTVSIFRAQK
jgi:hypothetical protein